ncbi:MAG: PEP-CTERM sorting domain-containing protein [Verrucomicrobiota bacterium]|nr:PEP-CTERM sorting domain-containing protein [Verrucomicrobiota bacterium]
MTNQATILASETGVEPASPYTFLFTPSFNNAGQIAGKVRLGAIGGNSDQIRIFDANPGNPSVLVAQTRDLDAASPFTRLDNSNAFNNAGDVAFEGTAASTGTRGLFLFHNGQITTIALADPAGMVRDLNFFAPEINDFGLIAFRGKDSANNDAIFVSDGTNLLRLIGVGDAIQTDRGADSIIAISGKPNLNNLGEVVFNVNLATGGSGVFVAQVPEPGSVALVLAGALLALGSRKVRRSMT